MTVNDLFKKNGILISATTSVVGLIAAWNKLPPAAKALVPRVGEAIIALNAAKIALNTATKTYATVVNTLNKIKDDAAKASLTGTEIAAAEAPVITANTVMNDHVSALNSAKISVVSSITNTTIPGT